MTAVIRLSSSRSTGWPRSTNATPAMPHMLGHTHAAARAAIGPPTHPQLETEHGPEPGRAIPVPALVGAQQPLDPGRPEDPTLAREGITEQVVGHVSELGPEPGAQGHAEAHLPACENLGGQAAGHGPL